MRWMDEFERFLVRAAAIGLVTLIVVQGLMTNDNIRFYLSLGERVEGRPAGIQASAPDRPNPGLKEAVPVFNPAMGSVSLSLKDYSSLSQAAVLVNGRVMGRFTRPVIKLYVTQGDVIEVDTSAYKNPVDFEVTRVSGNISSPSQGEVATACGGIRMVGKVVLK